MNLSGRRRASLECCGIIQTCRPHFRFMQCRSHLNRAEPRVVRIKLVAGLELLSFRSSVVLSFRSSVVSFFKYTRFLSSFTGTYVSILAVIFAVWEIRAFIGIVVLPLVCGKFFLMYLVLRRDLRDYCCSRLGNLPRSRFCWDCNTSACLW